MPSPAASTPRQRRSHASIFHLSPTAALFLLTALLASLAAPILLADEKPKSDATHHKLTIQVQGGDAWNASIADVEKVLHATAAELWKHFPGRKLDPILVAPKGGPIVLFKRGPNREYYVRLNTGDTYWSQYVFQFAHEMAHILCTYREGDTSNLWFEESICELASLYVLRQMSQTWKSNPPYPNWKSYAPKLADYAQDRIKAGTLPKDQTLAQWYQANAAALTKDGTQREMNAVVAVALLPLFEAAPHHWEAIAHINEGKSKDARSLAAYLKNWHDHAPERHRPFIVKIMEKFGLPAGS